jgi:hypothetical protein
MIPPPQADGPAAPGATGTINPAALTIEQVARMLAVPEETVRRHLVAGAPVGADGTVNLVNYAAWVCLMLRKEGR